MIDLPSTAIAVAEALADSGTLGALVSVGRGGVVVADLAVGVRVDGQPLTTSDWVPWYSASKLPATITVACAWEQGLLDPHDLVLNWSPASPASFGALGGTACSVVADPEIGIGVALYFLGNVMPEERVRRDQLVHHAIWRDLGITR